MSQTSKASQTNALQALTAAALVLPGLIAPSARAAENNSAEFQYNHYQEGKRQLFDVPNSSNPIEVDSIHGSATVPLTDRIKFAFNYTQDTWSGATPVSTAPLLTGGNQAILSSSDQGLIKVGASPTLNNRILLNRQLQPIQQNQQIDNRLVHIMSSASPETRKQGDFKLTYEWDKAALDIGGGISLENDYESRFGNIGGRFDFNQKLTTLKWGASYANSDTSAIIDHDASPYISKRAFSEQIELRGGSEILQGNKEDWSGQLGLTQILNKTALVDAGISYTHSHGYMENPYKAVSVVFIDPSQQADSTNALITGDVRALLEQRPDNRNQWAFNSQYVQYIGALDAALHVHYQFSHDDWGIDAHIFEADWVQPLGRGWSITPRVRYYSQSAADFYQPFLTSEQAFSRRATDASGREIWVDANNPDNGTQYVRDENFNLVAADGRIVDESLLNVQPKTVAFDPGQLPDNFSSDHRLSGFGALSGGLSISKQFAKGVNLEAGVEYYSHAGALKLGGGGEGAYADFDYFVANAALKVDLSALSYRGDTDAHAGHDHHTHSHRGHATPAGLMSGHFMKQADAFMVGYRFMYSRQAGTMLHGTQNASDLTIVNNACSAAELCRFTPSYMDMNMHMLNIMYAPTDWLNLMLMPQFMDMAMNLRELAGRPPVNPNVHEHTGIGGHATGGVGDTTASALIALFDTPGHHIHMGLGISAPTGAVDLQLRRIFQTDGGLIHFGMQLGSGTWDFLPSLTYTGEHAQWFWGAQVNGVKRLEDHNESGYRLGDVFQTTAWGGYQLTDWLTTSVRGVYTVQGSISGDFNSYNGRAGPMDFPANHGGRFWDVGFGLNASIPNGELMGNSFGFEWLQPVQDDVNGYRLEREGALTASWSYSF